MKPLKELFKNSTINRRSFLKYTGISSVSLSLGFPFIALQGKAAAADAPPAEPVAAWHNDANGNRYFVPTKLRTDAVNTSGKVTARVDGWWRTYDVREFSDEFHDFWLAEKNWYYEQLIAYFENQTDELRIPNGGHHHPMLSTYGRIMGRRGDSDFHLNTTVKGFALTPKEDKIDYINGKIQEAYDTGNIPVDVFKTRQQLYNDKSLWRKDRFATLELYSGRPINDKDGDGNYGFMETHTFQNITVNPMATLTYMSLYNTDGTESYFGGTPDLTPHFEFRGFCWLISYYNPANADYENKIAAYINKAHSGYHGGAADIATNIFLITEEFNNTPTYDPGRGKRVVPPYTYAARTADMLVVKPKSKVRLSQKEKLALIKKLDIPV